MAKKCACSSGCPCQCQKPRRRRRNHKVAPFARHPVYDLLSFLLAEKYKEPVNKPAIAKPEASAPKTAEVGVGTSVEAPAPATQEQPTAERFLSALRTGLEKGPERSRRGSIESVASYATSDPGMGGAATPRLTAEPTQSAARDFTEGERQVRETKLKTALSAVERVSALEANAAEVRRQALTNLEKVETGELTPAERGAAAILSMEAAGTLGSPKGKKKKGLTAASATGTPVGNILGALQAIPEQEAGSPGNVDFQ